MHKPESEFLKCIKKITVVDGPVPSLWMWCCGWCDDSCMSVSNNLRASRQPVSAWVICNEGRAVEWKWRTWITGKLTPPWEDVLKEINKWSLVHSFTDRHTQKRRGGGGDSIISQLQCCSANCVVPWLYLWAGFWSLQHFPRRPQRICYTTVARRRQNNCDKITLFSTSCHSLAPVWSGNPVLPLFLVVVVLKPEDTLTHTHTLMDSDN